MVAATCGSKVDDLGEGCEAVLPPGVESRVAKGCRVEGVLRTELGATRVVVDFHLFLGDNDEMLHGPKLQAKCGIVDFSYRHRPMLTDVSRQLRRKGSVTAGHDLHDHVPVPHDTNNSIRHCRFPPLLWLRPSKIPFYRKNVNISQER